MRWLAKKAPLVENTIRLIRRFLIIPRKIDGEWRWLEWATIAQRLRLVGYGEPTWYWEDECWWSK